MAKISLLLSDLRSYALRTSEDMVKTDLELVCGDCGTHVCDVEAGDTFELLLRTILGHDFDCPSGRHQTKETNR